MPRHTNETEQRGRGEGTTNIELVVKKNNLQE